MKLLHGFMLEILCLPLIRARIILLGVQMVSMEDGVNFIDRETVCG